jgi:dTDP-4-dehydrorhamnose 3,5-epimerase
MTVVLVTPRRFGDARGWFTESWNRARFEDWGIKAEFCQDNHSLSQGSGTLRGLHFQRAPHAQAKLVRCLKGRIFDVAVDIRRASPTYRRWVGVELSAEKGNQLFIPAGYAHGFVTLEVDVEVAYKVDAYYAPEADGGVAWDDPGIRIDWPLGGAAPLLSDKDAALPTLSSVDVDFDYDGNPLLPLNTE